ncbi:AN1-type zinc finger protein 2B [Ophiophagus hannah]|uniref:AN1-type zinc finger protein 2B n=1 Tax=Ophiophagus hannah TaxID=8665 RepID=V8N7E0_OPHHA|nr:AN1-type zinc finger protein 2B [Ophiophagus hannah]
MEFPDLGRHCWERSCRRLDFLPLKCDACQELFCKDHIIYSRHRCSSAYKKVIRVDGIRNLVKLGRRVFTNKCFQAGCRKKEMMRLVCDQCHQNFCLHHRHPLDHQCPGRIRPVSKAG